LNAAKRNRVRALAGNRCEYCRLPEPADSMIRFHIEHVIPDKHGGSSEEANLALACPSCIWAKGTNLTGIDSIDGAVTVLLNPRSQDWDDHFEFHGSLIVGRTPTGRVTAQVLNMNDEAQIDLRTLVET
jgi:hypothetical protein